METFSKPFGNYLATFLEPIGDLLVTLSLRFGNLLETFWNPFGYLLYLLLFVGTFGHILDIFGKSDILFGHIVFACLVVCLACLGSFDMLGIYEFLAFSTF